MQASFDFRPGGTFTITDLYKSPALIFFSQAAGHLTGTYSFKGSTLTLRGTERMTFTDVSGRVSSFTFEANRATTVSLIILEETSLWDSSSERKFGLKLEGQDLSSTDSPSSRTYNLQRKAAL